MDRFLQAVGQGGGRAGTCIKEGGRGGHMSSKSGWDLCRRSIFPSTCEEEESAGGNRAVSHEGGEKRRYEMKEMFKKKHDVAKGC